MNCTCTNYCTQVYSSKKPDLVVKLAPERLIEQFQAKRDELEGSLEIVKAQNGTLRSELEAERA